MTKVDIFSGFLGAGKTTLIKKLIADGYNGAKLVLIERLKSIYHTRISYPEAKK